MKHVELVHGHEVDEAQHVMLGHEVAGDVEQAAAPAEAWLVLDVDGRNLQLTARAGLAVGGRGHELPERLRRVERSGGAARRDPDSVLRHRQPIRLARQIVQGERDRARPWSGGRQVAADDGADLAPQPGGHVAERRVGGERGLPAEDEVSRP